MKVENLMIRLCREAYKKDKAIHIVGDFMLDRTFSLSNCAVYFNDDSKRVTETDNELIDAFQIAFPDCKITYGQQWIDRGKFNERRGKAIMIDWS